MAKGVKTVTAASLTAISKQLVASGQKFNAEMQNHICNIMAFAFTLKDGKANENMTPATELVLMIPRRADRDDIRTWFERHSSFKWNDEVKKGTSKSHPDGRAAGFTKDKKKATDFTFDLEACKADLWFAERQAATRAAQAPGAPRKTAYNLPKVLNGIVEKLMEIKDEKIEGDDIPDFLVTGLNALMIQYQTYLKGKELETAEAAAKAGTPATAEAPKVETPATRSGGNRAKPEETTREPASAAA